MPDRHVELHVLPERVTLQESSGRPLQHLANRSRAAVRTLPISHHAPAKSRNEMNVGHEDSTPSMRERSSSISETRSSESQLSIAATERELDIGWLARRVAARGDQKRPRRLPGGQEISHNAMDRYQVRRDGEQAHGLAYFGRGDKYLLKPVGPQEEAQEVCQKRESRPKQGIPGHGVQQRQGGERPATEAENDVEEPVLDTSADAHHREQGMRGNRVASKEGQSCSQTSDFDYTPIEHSEIAADGYPKLDSKPMLVRTWFLAVTIGIFSSFMAAVIALLLWGRKNGGVHYVHNTEVALAARYLPAVIGMATVLLWRSVISAFSRISPYISMAAKRAATGASALNDRAAQRTLHAYYADAMFAPSFWDLSALASNGHWLLFATTVASIIINFSLVGLKAVFVQTISHGTGWNVAISDKTGYALISIYGLLDVLAVAILVRIRNRDTGLKWDPVSIADQLALIQDSNIGALFAGLETSSYRDYRKTLRKRAPGFGPLRLGYWRDPRSGKIWHGIAFTRRPTVPASAVETQRHVETNTRMQPVNGNCNEESVKTRFEVSPQDDEKARRTTLWADAYSLEERPVNSRGNCVSGIEYFRYCSGNGLLSDTLLLIYTITALTVLTLVIVGLTNGRLQEGIHMKAAPPVDPAPHIATSPVSKKDLKILTEGFQINSPQNRWDTSDAFHTRNIKEGFLFRFLPTIFMGPWFIFLWSSADHFYRFAQTFAGMDEAAPATSNILLDYPSSLPVLVTFTALANKHWKVALFSFLSLMASVPPIVASGIFVGVPDATGFTEHIQPINFWASFSILVIYLLCIPLVRPTPAYRLPQGIYTIAHLIKFCYASRIFEEKLHGEPIFYVQGAKDERVHLLSRVHLARRNYQFGLYLGTDGRRHLGFDVAERQNASGQLEYVDKIESGRVLYLGLGLRMLFRRPRVVRKLE